MNNRKLHGMKKENIMKQNKVIQIAIFGVIFLISLFIWNYTLVGRNNQGVTETQQPTFPLLTISVDGKDINELHGYQGDVDASLIRDSITPVYENQVKVILKDATEDISVVSYKLYDTDNKTVLGNGDTAFHKGKEKSTANIQIKERLENGKTYLMELCVKQDNKTIRYFTRIIYGTSFHLKECLNFAEKFHNAALTEGNTEFISQYLETAEGTTSNNLSNVTLKSTQEAVSYATLKPQVESIYPATVKEISDNVTSVELRYILSAENSDGTKQYYQATEYFRIRYAKDRMYLLNYERNMEAYMRYDTIDRSNNRILLGIGSNQKQVVSKKGGKKVFVTGGAGGIGKAIVEAFCKLNYQVAFCDKNELEGQQTAQATGAQFYPVDLNSKEALELCLQNIFKEWGDIDIIINNAGVCEFTSGVHYFTCVGSTPQKSKQHEYLRKNH